MIVQERTHSPVRGSFRRSQMPAKGEQGRTVGRGEEMRLLRTFLASPFEKSARRHNAAPLLERGAEHRFVRYGFSARVEPGTSLGDFFHQAGTKLQRIDTSSRARGLGRRLTSTVSVGAML